MKESTGNGNSEKESDMFTIGCCITCLSIRGWCVARIKKIAFDLAVRRAARF
jgi:hypothetical protein